LKFKNFLPYNYCEEMKILIKIIIFYKKVYKEF